MKVHTNTGDVGANADEMNDPSRRLVRSSKRGADSDDDGDCTFTSRRRGQPRSWELPFLSRDAVGDEVAAAGGDPLEAIQVAYRVLCDAWMFLTDVESATNDGYTAETEVSAPGARALLLRFAGFTHDAGLGRLVPNVRLPNLTASLGATLAEVEGRLERAYGWHIPEFGLAALDVDGFGWSDNENTLPSYIAQIGCLPQRTQPADAMDCIVLFDAALTHAGAPLLGATTGMDVFRFHRRFGLGVAILTRQNIFRLARPCFASFVEDWCVAGAVMLTVEGPLLVAVDVRQHQSGAQCEALAAFVESLRDGRVSTLLVANGDLAETIDFLLGLGWSTASSHSARRTLWVKLADANPIDVVEVQGWGGGLAAVCRRQDSGR